MVALLAVFVGMGRPAPAQAPSGASITPVQGLSFGQLIGGIPQPVAPSDPLQRAHFVVEGERRLDLRLVLPTVLRAVNGAVIPVAFGSSDGVIALENDPIVVFDPNTTVEVRFRGRRTVAQVYLGGVATPAIDQAAGSYSATVTIILSDPRA
jgi:hypothetical protein